MAHGSRDPEWRQPIEAVAAEIRKQQPELQVLCAYLELTSPTLPHAAAELIASGIDRLRVLPLFLGMGKHARQDIPKLVSQIRASHPGIEVELMPAIGESAQFRASVATIVRS